MPRKSPEGGSPFAKTMTDATDMQNWKKNSGECHESVFRLTFARKRRRAGREGGCQSAMDIYDCECRRKAQPILIVQLAFTPPQIRKKLQKYPGIPRTFWKKMPS
jgi:hypothetical protein